MRASFLTSVAVLALAGVTQVAHAQTAPGATPGPMMTDQASPATSPAAAAAADDSNPGEIIITATKRSQRLSDVPIAVSAVTAEALQNSGVSDIRQLNQLSPSLLVSSTSSEAGAGVARIRGIGTVGDNPGLESSVAVFIDGVYRSRSGVGLTELGEVERIEVLRGPQGTLFGRNASAGLINVVTAQPKFDPQGHIEGTYGNYNYYRIAGGVTGGVTDKIALRFDGVYSKRDGFIRDLTSGRDLNNRDRYLLRGQVLLQPTDDISLRIIGDYASRKEECCASTYNTPIQTTVRDAQGNIVIQSGVNGIANILNGLGANLQLGDPYNRVTAITAGRNYNSNVKDKGISGELTWDFGGATLTSISAYRDWRVLSGQDADFNALDILYRPGGAKRQFRTLSQELRLNGRAFEGKLDWLVGAYYAYEKLDVTDNLTYGADFQRYADCLVANGLSGTAASIGIPGLLQVGAPGCVNRAVATAIATNPGIPAALRGPIGLFGGLAVPGLFGYDAVAAAVGQPGNSLVGDGLNDAYRQNSRNYAFFTHNVINVTDRLSLTLGLRYTNERKEVFANIQNSGNPLCTAIQTSPTLSGLATLPCVIPSRTAGSYSGVKKEDRFSGTAVLAFKPVDDLLLYGSYSRGYKAGGYNLDRSALSSTAPNIAQLQFEPETVEAYEVGAKLRGRQFNLNIAGFYSAFSNFQLNTFNGINFIVENIAGCKAATTTGVCAGNNTKAGVVSQGVEIEASLYPTDHIQASVGVTYADTKYRQPLVGFGGRAIPGALALLPGQRLSNAPQYVVTTSLGFTPPIGDTGMSGLFYVDARLQSDIRTGSDLFPEKTQDAFVVVNARIGLNGKDRRWSIEAWAQNLLNQDYTQVGFNTPLQGGGSLGLVQAGRATRADTLFSSFLSEPRTYGVTVRTRF